MVDQIYTMKITLKGEPRVLTIRVGESGMDVMLTDKSGKELEYFKQEGNQIGFTDSKSKKAKN
ncbi:hypothetical protein HYT84_01900 [Candidatus Micrarchaeota archaeon]|nr:hypothetical protein [Candidatus Micrarchaeota archaeon]